MAGDKKKNRRRKIVRPGKPMKSDLIPAEGVDEEEMVKRRADAVRKRGK